MLTNSGTGMAIGIVWCVIGILVFIMGRLIKNQKRLRQLTYGFSLAGIFMGSSYLFDNLSFAYVGTNLLFICVILLLIEVTSKSHN